MYAFPKGRFGLLGEGLEGRVGFFRLGRCIFRGMGLGKKKKKKVSSFLLELKSGKYST